MADDTSLSLANCSFVSNIVRGDAFVAAAGTTRWQAGGGALIVQDPRPNTTLSRLVFDGNSGMMSTPIADMPSACALAEQVQQWTCDC